MLRLTNIKENEQKAGTHKDFLRSPLGVKKQGKEKQSQAKYFRGQQHLGLSHDVQT